MKTKIVVKNLNEVAIGEVLLTAEARLKAILSLLGEDVAQDQWQSKKTGFYTVLLAFSAEIESSGTSQSLSSFMRGTNNKLCLCLDALIANLTNEAFRLMDLRLVKSLSYDELEQKVRFKLDHTSGNMLVLAELKLVESNFIGRARRASGKGAAA